MKMPPTKKNQKQIQNESLTNNRDRIMESQMQEQRGSCRKEHVCCCCLFQVEEESPDLCITQCNHFYHKKCLDSWFQHQNTCCICRAVIKNYQMEGKTIQAPPRPVRSIQMANFINVRMFLNFLEGDTLHFGRLSSALQQLDRLVGFDNLGFSQEQRTIIQPVIPQVQRPLINPNNNNLIQQENLPQILSINQPQRPHSKARGISFRQKQTKNKNIVKRSTRSTNKKQEKQKIRIKIEKDQNQKRRKTKNSNKNN